jgi:hypothetical protein
MTKARPSKRWINDEKDRQDRIRQRRGMRTETAWGTPVGGDREGCGKGRIARREMIVNRMNEGDMVLNMKSVVSVAILVEVDMVVRVITGCSSKRDGRGLRPEGWREKGRQSRRHSERTMTR